MDISSFSTSFEVKKICRKDVPAVLELYKSNPLYFQYCPPQPSVEGVMKDLESLPVGKKQKDKEFLGFWQEEQLAAVIDIVYAYPTDDTVYIGLLMLHHSYQGKGLGTVIISELLDYLSSYFTFVRLGYVKGNKQAQHFWKKQGFKETGEISHQKEFDVILMTKKCDRK